MVQALALGVVLQVSPAAALDYEYHAPTECPSRAAFIEATESRLKHPADQSQVDHITVTVVATGVYRATFVLFEGGGLEPAQRMIEASDCEQAVKALALVAALALDARTEARGQQQRVDATAAFEEPPPQAPPSRMNEPPEAVGEPAVGEPPVNPIPLTPAVQPSPMPPASAPRVAPILTLTPHGHEPRTDFAAPVPTGEASRRRLLGYSLELGPFAATGYAPRPSIGPALAFAMGMGQIELALQAFYGLKTIASEQDQRAQFSVFGARLRPCYRLLLGGPVTSRGCAGFEMALVDSQGLQGDGVVDTKRETTPFYALGLAAGLAGKLGDSVNLQGDLGLQFPLRTGRFRFANANEDLHEYPRVATRGDLSVGYHF